MAANVQPKKSTTQTARVLSPNSNQGKQNTKPSRIPILKSTAQQQNPKTSSLTQQQIENRKNWPRLAAMADEYNTSYEQIDAALQKGHKVCSLIPENQRLFATEVLGVATATASLPYAGKSAVNALRGLNWLYNKSRSLYNGKKSSEPKSKEIPGLFESFPDRILPFKGRNKLTDPEAAGRPNTQLGTRTNQKGQKYRQAREFDANGKPVRDIDFMDHNFPEKHPNPHQHDWINKGTQRSREAKPLEPFNASKLNVKI